MTCSFYINPSNDNGGGGGGGSTVTVVNSLTSTSISSALSANMGNTLKIMIDGVQANLTQHVDEVASSTEYGHVKIDDVTIKVNANGQIYAVGSGGTGNGTVKSVNDILPDVNGNVEIPYATATAYGLTQLHDTVDDTDDKALTPAAVKRYIESITDELVKEELVFTGLTGNPITIEFTPTIVGDNFISIVFRNTIKALPTDYTIEHKDASDPSKGYILTLNTTASMVNLVLISGKAINSPGGSSGEVKLQTKSARINVPAGSTSLPINITGFNPNKHTIFLFDNTTKVFNDTFEIVDSVTATSGYEIQFITPPTNIQNRNYEINIIEGS